ncbi:MAG: hypothetical protein NVSMB47_15000 [Polyangiales bacterium]
MSLRGFAVRSVTIGGLAIACAPPARSVCAEPRVAERTADTPNLEAPAAGKATPPAPMILRLTTDPDGPGRILGELRLAGALASVSTLRFQPSHGARVEAISARDVAGEIALRQSTDASGTTAFELARRAAGPLDVRYAVTFAASADAYAPFAEPIEMSAAGEDVLVLPDTTERSPVELHLKTGGVVSGGASSFAIGNEQHFVARPSELRGAYFFAGDVGTATFHGTDGDDFAAWIGFTAFDPRWVSAEIAGFRSAADAYVGRTTTLDAPPNSILFAATRRDERPVSVSSRTRGVVLSLDRRAAWTPAVRITVTQALMRRYVGGVLFVGDPRDEASGTFFSEGFSRTIARELLFDAGWLSAIDRAAELNALLATLAFAEAPRVLAATRGALVATALDVGLQARSAGKASLKSFVRERLAEAVDDKKDTLSLAELTARVGESAGEPVAREMEATLRNGAEMKLPSDLAGRCFRLVPKQLVAFELGLVTSSADVMTVESVKAGSRAEAAGVRVGDVVSEIHYEQGRAAVPVKLVVVRGEKKVLLRFLPAGATKQGRQFERIAGLPDERC